MSFRYEPDAPWTLEGISAEIPAGTRTALVGETGSGKTTLRTWWRAFTRRSRAA